MPSEIVLVVNERPHTVQATPVNHAWWEFEIATQGTVIVEAIDLTGNCTRHEA